MNEESTQNFLAVVRNRVIAYTGLGYSLVELDQRIKEFDKHDFCWASLNYTYPIERILSKIDKHLEIVTAFPNEYHENVYSKVNLVLYQTIQTPLGNSLFEFLRLCKNFNLRVILFGFDGFVKSTAFPITSLARDYPEQKCPLSSKASNYERDTKQFNALVDPHLTGVRVLNCSLNSSYLLPKCSFQDIVNGRIPE